MIFASPMPGSISRVTPDDADDAYCPSCDARLIAKRGSIVVHHWSHRVDECDPWSEPESEWHRMWKRDALVRGDRVEVPMGPHRADIVRTNGRIVELQATYLSADKIRAREAFYGPNLVWVYRADRFAQRVVNTRGNIIWWKSGAKSLLAHRRPIFWHLEESERIVHIRLWPFEVGGAMRIYGKMLRTFEVNAA